MHVCMYIFIIYVHINRRGIECVRRCCKKLDANELRPPEGWGGYSNPSLGLDRILSLFDRTVRVRLFIYNSMQKHKYKYYFTLVVIDVY